MNKLLLTISILLFLTCCWQAQCISTLNNYVDYANKLEDELGLTIDNKLTNKDVIQSSNWEELEIYNNSNSYHKGDDIKLGA